MNMHCIFQADDSQLNNQDSDGTVLGSEDSGAEEAMDESGCPTLIGVKRYIDISVHRDILCTIRYIDTNMKISIQNDTTLP